MAATPTVVKKVHRVTAEAAKVPVPPAIDTAWEDIIKVIDYVQEQSPNPLTQPAKDAAKAIRGCVITIKFVTQEFDRRVAERKPHWLSIAERAGNSAASSVDALAAGFVKNGKTAELIAGELAKTRAELAKSTEFRSTKGEAAAEALKAYDKAIAKAQVSATSLLPPAGEAFTMNPIALERMRAELESWTWERAAKHYDSLLKLFEGGEMELELFEVLLLQRVNAFERERAQIAASTSPREIEAILRVVGQVKGAIAGRRAARVPPWLGVHEHTIFPAITAWFRNVCGVNIRQLSALELAKYDRQEQKFHDIYPGWVTRYCLPDDRDFMGKGFSLDLAFRAPGQVPFSELLAKSNGNAAGANGKVARK